MKSSFRELLKQYWGFDDFRGVQAEIIESITSGHDTLGLMPTGGGKSITFQVPALAMEGVCVVITPLIALMNDQVQNLRKRGIRAAAIHSDMQQSEIVRLLENAIFGGVKLLYVSPERLSSPLFRTKLRHMKVSFFCVDEAHCISQWGYDFRPSYLDIAKVRNDFPDTPMLALTATATPDVVDDIQKQLHFKNQRVFKMSFERKNLSYIVRYTIDKSEQLIHILKNVEGSAIVYARSRQRTKDFAEILTDAGISATFFHAGLETAEKNQRQNDWQQDRIRVMVATNAFGMGIDKPDVRVVIHIDCPSSIEAYFQEAGRAGRDGQKAYAVLLCNRNDARKLQKRIRDTFPEKDYIRRIYDCLAYFYEIGVGAGYNKTFEFPLERFCKTYGFFPIQADAALKILHHAGYIEYIGEQESQARVMFILERDELYRLKGNTPEEDSVIISLLRNYSGLFNDYAYIDESQIAQLTGLSKPVVYGILKDLSHKRIISFIPRKQIPYIRYTQRREDSCYLQFPPEVYDQLRIKLEKRIEAMTQYFMTNNQCRSRQLLRYFGEEQRDDCGQCDVCLERKGISRDEERKAENCILDLLKDGKPHELKELNDLPLPFSLLDKVLRYLLNEEEVITEGLNIYLPK